MMQRLNFKTLVAAIGLALVGIACDFSEPICACEFPYFSAPASGTVTDAAGAPVANTPFLIIGMAAGREFVPPETAEAYFQKTDANGKFAAEVIASATTQEIRAAFYPAGRSVVVVNAGMATFQTGGVGADTVKLAIVLPP